MDDSSLTRDPRFDANPKRHAHRAELEQRINTRFSLIDADGIVALLERANIANARVNTMEDVWQHPQLLARNRWVEIDSPVGKLPAIRPPACHDDFEYRMDGVPALGQHSKAILAELGFTSSEIGHFVDAEVI